MAKITLKMVEENSDKLVFETVYYLLKWEEHKLAKKLSPEFAVTINKEIAQFKVDGMDEVNG